MYFAAKLTIKSRLEVNMNVFTIVLYHLCNLFKPNLSTI